MKLIGLSIALASVGLVGLASAGGSGTRTAKVTVNATVDKSATKDLEFLIHKKFDAGSAALTYDFGNLEIMPRANDAKNYAFGVVNGYLDPVSGLPQTLALEIKNATKSSITLTSLSIETTRGAVTSSDSALSPFIRLTTVDKGLCGQVNASDSVPQQLYSNCTDKPKDIAAARMDVDISNISGKGVIDTGKSFYIPYGVIVEANQAAYDAIAVGSAQTMSLQAEFKLAASW